MVVLRQWQNEVSSDREHKYVKIFPHAFYSILIFKKTKLKENFNRSECTLSFSMIHTSEMNSEHLFFVVLNQN